MTVFLLLGRGFRMEASQRFSEADYHLKDKVRLRVTLWLIRAMVGNRIEVLLLSSGFYPLYFHF